MQTVFRSVRVKPLLVIAAIVGALIAFRRPAAQVGVLLLGGAALAFLLAPLAQRLERAMSRPLAALTSLAVAVLALAGLLWLFLPTLARELSQLTEALPRSLARLTEWAESLSRWIGQRVPGARLPDIPTDRLPALIGDVATGALTLAGGAADALSRLSLMGMLGYFFLCDRENLLLRLELLVPQSARCAAVRMGGAVAREVRLYFQGQLLVALAVGALTALGLLIIGVRSAVVLGVIVGTLNMVPYFGPFIGGVPAVLIALSDGWQKALICLGVLTLVQQLDSAIISPRIMGSLTGFSPAAVLISIYAGACFGGIGGMLIALPVLMSIRTILRVFVQECENN